jgi:predicted amidohydrolase YtcJ
LTSRRGANYIADYLGGLIRLDSDVLTCPVGEIKETKVLLTVVGGSVVFEKK